ncbi:MAG: hypothetical protein KGL90_06540 [Burkholderiales bacterium]|nr:hypothetical protein [Burkholderiales bacterium]
MMRQLLQRLGLPGLLGLIMMALAAWTHIGWLPTQQAEADAVASQARRLRHELLGANAAARSPQDKAMTPETAWPTLWQALPTAAQRTRLQADVLDRARTLGLNVTAVQYRGGADGVPHLWRQRMVMPVEGPYPVVRAWLAQLLSEPSLSLDALDIQRPDVMSDSVKARVSVSLWWRDIPAEEAR